MIRLIARIKDCDGRFCEDVATYAFGVAVFTLMFMSIAQLT